MNAHSEAIECEIVAREQGYGGVMARSTVIWLHRTRRQPRAGAQLIPRTREGAGLTWRRGRPLDASTGRSPSASLRRNPQALPSALPFPPAATTTTTNWWLASSLHENWIDTELIHVVYRRFQSTSCCLCPERVTGRHFPQGLFWVPAPAGAVADDVDAGSTHPF